MATIGILAVLAMTPGTAANCDGLVDGPKGKVVSVTDGDTALLDNGITVRLIGIQAPKLPQGRDFDAWPLAETARAALAQLTLGQQVRVRYGGERRDRHGRTLGQLFVLSEPELWVQQQLLNDGLARVYSFPDNRACLDELMAAETRARRNRLGIWADPYYAVRRADRPLELMDLVGAYELIEGRVLAAETVRGSTYLNFGRHWKEDFTVVIDKSALARFARDGIDPLAFDGAELRVRGWLDNHDGPRIEVTHPEQIEVLTSQ